MLRPAEPSFLPTGDDCDADGTVVEVLHIDRKFAKRHYLKNGEVTCEYGSIQEALKIV